MGQLNKNAWAGFVSQYAPGYNVLQDVIEKTV